MNDGDEIRLPLADWVQQVAERAGRVAAQEVIDRHEATCLARMVPDEMRETERRLDVRIRRTEIGLAKLIGLSVGSGVLGAGTITGIQALMSALGGG